MCEQLFVYGWAGQRPVSIIILDTATLPGQDDADWQQAVALRPGDCVVTASNASGGQGDAAHQITFTVTGEPKAYELAVHDLCYVPGENALLLITDALRYDMDREAQWLDDLLAAVDQAAPACLAACATACWG